jgi:hypothetical protein
LALAEKCLELLFVPTLLFVLFVFARNRFRQVMQIGAIFIVSVVVLRLLRLHSGDEPLLANEAYFLIAIAVLYGLVWLITRYLGVGTGSSTRRN